MCLWHASASAVWPIASGEKPNPSFHALRPNPPNLPLWRGREPFVQQCRLMAKTALRDIHGDSARRNIAGVVSALDGNSVDAATPTTVASRRQTGCEFAGNLNFAGHGRLIAGDAGDLAAR